MNGQITILAKLRFKKFRESGAIEVDTSQTEGQLLRLMELAGENGYKVVAKGVVHKGYPECSIVSIPNTGRRAYALALIDETEVDSLRAEVKRLREKMDAARAELE